VDTVLIAFLFAADVGIVFGLWPARKALPCNPSGILLHTSLFCPEEGI